MRSGSVKLEVCNSVEYVMCAPQPQESIDNPGGSRISLKPTAKYRFMANTKQLASKRRL